MPNSFALFSRRLRPCFCGCAGLWHQWKLMGRGQIWLTKAHFPVSFKTAWKSFLWAVMLFPIMPKPLGRPTVYMLQEAEEILLNGGTRSDVGKRWGYKSTGQLNKMMVRYPEVAATIENAENLFIQANTAVDNPDPLVPKDVSDIPEIVHPELHHKKRLPLLQDLRDKKKEEEKTPEGMGPWPFVWGLLPPALRPLWEEIGNVHRTWGLNLYDLLKETPRHHLQQMFLFSYAEMSFDTSRALLTLAMTRDDLEKWIRTDVDFNTAWRAMIWHKRNVYEMCLLKVCLAGAPTAVVFANKTQNAQRGYIERDIKNVLDGANATKTEPIPVDQLELPLEVRKQMLEAVRRAQAKQKEGGSK